jgi:hypothetical protein
MPIEAPDKRSVLISTTIITGSDAICSVFMPANEPTKTTAERYMLDIKNPTSAPRRPTREEATTADTPYPCNEKVITAPPAPPKTMRSIFISAPNMTIPIYA